MYHRNKKNLLFPLFDNQNTMFKIIAFLKWEAEEMGVESAKSKNGTIIYTDSTECGTGEPNVHQQSIWTS